MMRRTVISMLATGAMASGLPRQALSQTYPVKPIRIIVPFAVGGSSDIMARGLGKQLAEQMNARSEEHTSELQSH